MVHVCVCLSGSGQKWFEVYKQRCGAMLVTGEMLAIWSFFFIKAYKLHVFLCNATEPSVCGRKNARTNK